MARWLVIGWAALSAWALVGCATLPSASEPGGWHAVRLPGKPATDYRRSVKDGRPVWSAAAQRSASMWRRVKPAGTLAPTELTFSWRVDHLPGGASVTDPRRDDAASRLVLAFDGDLERLSPRNRTLFDLARSLTGETPPYATLMYVWDAQAPVGTVVISERSDRIRKIVVEPGTQGLGQWRQYRRNVAADFRLAFGEAPGAWLALALMTDADNTGSQAKAWYGDIAAYGVPVSTR